MIESEESGLAGCFDVAEDGAGAYVSGRDLERQPIRGERGESAAARPRPPREPWRVLSGGAGSDLEFELADREPPPRVWAGIEAALRAEGRIRD